MLYPLELLTGSQVSCALLCVAEPMTADREQLCQKSFGTEQLTKQADRVLRLACCRQFMALAVCPREMQSPISHHCIASLVLQGHQDGK